MIDPVTLTQRIYNNRVSHLTRHNVQLPTQMVAHLMAECASIAYAVADEMNGTETELPVYVTEESAS